MKRESKKILKLIISFVVAVVFLLGMQMQADDIRYLATLDEEQDKETNHHEFDLESTDKKSEEFSGTDDSSKSAKKPHPVMHTFFEPFHRVPGIEVSDPMLERWKEEWQKAGWETVVLDLSDAESHPYFDTMREAVSEVFKTDLYNRFCFYRHLAMANSGGGWMSDYDTLPTNFPMEEAYDLPNDGKFTSYQSFVPALISATADEWLRVSKLMVENIPKTKQLPPSDMAMLIDLKEEGGHDIVWEHIPDNIRKPIEIYKDTIAKIDCEKMAIGRAIHFSHHGFHLLYNENKFPFNANYPLSTTDKSIAAKLILDAWKNQCADYGSKQSSSLLANER